MVRRTKEEAQATREHLLDTAEQVFLDRGLSRSSLQDIAAAAGLTRGAIYWHFADKLALFDAMLARVDLPLEQVLVQAEARALTAAGAGADPLEGLRTVALAPFELMQAQPRTRRVFTILLHRTEFVGELAPLAGRQNEALRAFLLRLARLMEAARAAGTLGAGIDPHEAAVALLALIDGLLRLCTQADCSAMLMRTVPVAVDALLAGLRRPAAAQPA